jgi:hypothetical protein
MWIRRFILFHGKRHPAAMGADEVNAFLSSLAIDAKVAAATQNQALSALIFLYRVVRVGPLPWLHDLVVDHAPTSSMLSTYSTAQAFACWRRSCCA